MKNERSCDIKKGEGRTIKAGGAWIFDNEIDTVMGSFENGEIVVVHDFDGYPMGKGFINTNSKIRIRMLTRHVDQEIDRTFLQMRVKMPGIPQNDGRYIILPCDLREADFCRDLSLTNMRMYSWWNV